MRVDISGEAASLIRSHGGRVWVWAARPRMCCSGSPAWMHAALDPPPGIAGFAAVPVSAGMAADQPDQLIIYFRASAGMYPDVLEIGIQGKHRPGIAAFWDGCLMAMTG